MVRDRKHFYLIVQIILAFCLFLALAGDGVTEFFGGDDVMNLFTYMAHPLGHWALGIVEFWSSNWYRPMGGIVYLLLFDAFGFHALPFKIVLFAMLLLNMVVYFRTARRLGSSTQLAAWALLFCAYHAAFNALYLNFGTIYDLLAYLCYFSALLLYVRCLDRPNRRIASSLAILAIYIVGLTSKEIAVSLPAVLLAFNVLCTTRLAAERVSWVWKSGLPILLCSAAGGVYVAGKLTGPDSLATQAQYAPHFTLHQFALISAHYMRELFYLPAHLPTPTGALWVLAVMLAIAILLRSGLLAFFAISIVISQLPVSFITPRGAFAVYIPFAFWGLYFAGLVTRVQPIFRSPARAFACFIAAAAALGTIHHHMKHIYDPNFTVQAAVYQTFIRQLDAWNVHPSPKSRVLLMNDPFRADWIGWDPLFLVNVRDATTGIVVTRMKFATSVLPVSEGSWYDYVIDYDGRWRLLRGNGISSTMVSTRINEIAAQAEVVLEDGVEPPTQDQLRAVGPRFSFHVIPKDAGPRQFALSLFTFKPVRLSVEQDGKDATDEGVHGPGNIDLSVPLHPNRSSSVSFGVTDASGKGPMPQVLLISARLLGS